MLKSTGPIAALAVAAMLAACSSAPVGGDAGRAPVESRTPVPAGAGGAGTAGGAGAGGTTDGTPQSRVASVDLSRGGAGSAQLAAPSQRILYFDFDSFVIRDEFKPLLDGHAKVLAASRGKRMVIEGHTDERGGREYNLALGQKRAEAVLKSLALLGTSESQLEAVSFGKERPAVDGHDEAAWAKNRRAELKDR